MAALAEAGFGNNAGGDGEASNAFIAYAKQMFVSLQNQIRDRNEACDGSTAELKDAIEKLKALLAGIRPGGGGAGMDPRDLERLNNAIDRMEGNEQVLVRLQREVNSIDHQKMKIDIQTIMNQVAQFVQRDDFSQVQDDVRKLRKNVEELKALTAKH